MRRLALTLALGFIVLGVRQHLVVHAQQVHEQTVSPTSANELRDWNNTIDRMLRSQELQVRLEREDTLIPGRIIQQLDQFYRGIPIWGAGVSRQLADGIAVSIFGALYEDITLNTTPGRSEDQARAALGQQGTIVNSSLRPELTIFPHDGIFRLVWMSDLATQTDTVRVFLDADTLEEVHHYSLLEAQLPPTASVGHGIGVLGDDKKISTRSVGSSFVAFDTIRPPDISTFDFRGNLTRAGLVLNGLLVPSASDYAVVGASNEWTDGSVVDAHAHSSYTYDYYFKRFGRKGLDNGNVRIWNLTHLVRRSDIGLIADLNPWLNAMYSSSSNTMYYGEGCDFAFNFFGFGQQKVNYFSGALDVVAHELTHGVTNYSSRLIYQNESGALNESFSDIMGTSVEFFVQPAGNGPMKADYLIGEDVITAAGPGALSGLRSMENPTLYGQPDHYSRRLIVPVTNDFGGVHTNSGISNNAFYLAIEGGTNRTSGIRVQGVGASNREQIEKVFYRGFTQLMPAGGTFSIARATTLQAAIDLYGANSPPYNAVRDAWTAVGVN